MTQYTVNVQDTETSSQDVDVREAELVAQNWNRKTSLDLAKSEGIRLNDEHWVVIRYLRKHYLEQGLPRHGQRPR
jgi:sulfur relay (sulfurtransferase) DsrC/TusE family protein